MTLLTAPVVDAAAGSEVPIWLASVVTDDPAELTVLPTVDVTGAAGLVPDGGEPAAPPPALGALPDGAGGEPGAPVKVAGPMRVTRPPGALPEPDPPSVPATDEGPGDPAAAAVASRPPGAAKPVDAEPEVLSPPPCPAARCRPCAATFDRAS